jgi:hypothetical protein
MISVWQRVQSYCAAIFPSRPHENWSCAPGPMAGLIRRHEPRVAAGKPCEFALTHALGVDDVVFEEGAGMTVNQSPSGMQLLLAVAPRCGQLLEVHLDCASMQRTVSLVEVRWTKPVRDDQHGQLHLVGCRLTFGPSRYWAF